MRAQILIGALVLLLPGVVVGAPLLSATVTYQEIGGPQDTIGKAAVGDLFTIVNLSDFDASISQVLITFSAGLVFDTANGGLGTDPSYPFSSGVVDPNLVSGGNIADGSNVANLAFTGFGAGEIYSFSVDVDELDGINANQRRQVLGNELSGTIAVTFEGGSLTQPVTLVGEFSGVGQTATATVSAIVPEPTGLALLTAGFLALPLVARSRSRRRHTW